MEKPEFLKLEYEKSIELYKTQINTIIRSVISLTVLNVTAVGLGIREDGTPWLFAIGAMLTIVIAVVGFVGERTTRVFLLRAIEIEHIFGFKHHSLMSQWGIFSHGQNFQKYLAALKVEDPNERIKVLKKIKSILPYRLLFPLTIVAIAVQIILAIWGFDLW